MSYSEKTEDVVKTLLNGGVLLYPTDTIYGLGCDASDQAAVERIYDCKERPAEKSFLVLAGGLETVSKQFQISEEENRVLSKIWPGPFTCLLTPITSGWEHITGPTGKVAIRCAETPFLSNLFQSWDGLLISTSANLSGQDYQHDNAVQTELWQEKVDLLVLQDPYPTGTPSAIIVYEDGEWKTLRPGPISIEEALKSA